MSAEIERAICGAVNLEGGKETCTRDPHGEGHHVCQVNGEIVASWATPGFASVVAQLTSGSIEVEQAVEILTLGKELGVEAGPTQTFAEKLEDAATAIVGPNPTPWLYAQLVKPRELRSKIRDAHAILTFKITSDREYEFSDAGLDVWVNAWENGESVIEEEIARRPAQTMCDPEFAYDAAVAWIIRHEGVQA